MSTCFLPLRAAQPRPPLAFALAATCLLLAPLSQAFADTVWMENGDRLTGTIKALDGGKLLIETPYGGTISVDKKAIRTLESQTAVLLPGGIKEGDKQVDLKAAEPGKVAVVADTGKEIKPLSELDTFMKPKARIPDLVWKGNATVGLNTKKASSETSNYSAIFNGEASHGDWRHIIGANYNKDTEDEDVNTNNYGGRYSLDYFLTQKMFWEGRTFYKRDKVEDLSRQFALGTGPGYQFWDDELGAFSLTGLLGRVYYKYQDGGRDNFYAAGVRWDYRRVLYEQKLEAYVKGEFSRPLSNTADFTLDLDTGLRYKLTDWAALTVSYGRAQVSGGRQTVNERRFMTGLGMTW
jgi:hypothetical protein